ncbi:MAG: hypothetical protein ACRDXF_01605, partial [Acidimicrobiia bacterium]
MTVRVSAVIGLALLTGCAGEVVGVTSSPITTTSNVPASGPLHAVVPDRPLLAQGSVEGGDHLFVSAAASVDDVVYAYIIGFSENESRVMVMSWGEDNHVIRADPGVDGLGLDLEYPGPMPTSVIRQRDGTWVMHGFGVPASPGATPVFWRAVSDSPTGPWHDPSIVYEVGGTGAWDGAWIDFPGVFTTGEGLIMLYEGASDAEPDSSHLGIVASTDGITWDRPASPAVSPDDCEDVVSIRMPRLLAVEEGWLLAFSAITGRDEEPTIRLATGQDPPRHFCAGAEVALSADDLPDSGGIHSYALIQAGSGPALLV